MIRFNLKKFLSRQDIYYALKDLTSSLNLSFSIYDNQHQLLWGNYFSPECPSYPLYLENDSIGLVQGEEKTQPISNLLNLLLKQEFNKKIVANEALDTYEEIHFLYEISEKINSCQTAREICQLMIREIEAVIEATEITILLINPETNLVEKVASLNPEFTTKTPISHGVGIGGDVLNTGRAEIVNQVEQDERYLSGGNSLSSLICVPLNVQHQTIGIVNVGHQKKVNYTAKDLKLLIALTSQTAGAIQRSQYYEKLHNYSYSLEKKVAERTLALKKANRKLEILANLDGLTKVANRRRFDKYLQQQWLKQRNEVDYLSLILCDVDFFKPYNDFYLHQAGDECLKKIAAAIKKGVNRDPDLVARYGGEEFAIILPTTESAGAVKVAEKIRLKIKKLQIKHEKSAISDFITLSMGIATIIPIKTSSPEELIKAADSALFQSKKEGRDRYCLQVL